MKFEKVVLEGTHVRLEPLAAEHKAGLCDAISDGQLWKLFVTRVPRIEEIDRFYVNAQAEFEAGQGLAFATIDKASGRVAGSTRFLRASLPDRRAEIGFTFLGQTWQKTPINTEAKLLMLQHGFERLELNRIEFLTDFLNSNSRRAILRLGAKEEGILRSHMIMPDGRSRDSVVYSVIKNEWPGVKQNLQYKLAHR